MTGKNNKFDELSNQLNENIVAVKGTLELVDTAVAEDEMHDLVLKSIERMDLIQKLSGEMLIVLRNCLDKLGQMQK